MIQQGPSPNKGEIPVLGIYPKTHQAIVADVMFGSPNRRCEGQGICKVIAPIAHELDTSGRWGCNRATALIWPSGQGKLVFQFVIRSMCRSALGKYFRKGAFYVESPFEFRQNCWEPDKCLRIAPGVYPVKRTKDFLTAEFSIEKK